MLQTSRQKQIATKKTRKSRLWVHQLLQKNEEADNIKSKKYKGEVILTSGMIGTPRFCILLMIHFSCGGICACWTNLAKFSSDIPK